MLFEKIQYYIDVNLWNEFELDIWENRFYMLIPLGSLYIFGYSKSIVRAISVRR